MNRMQAEHVNHIHAVTYCYQSHTTKVALDFPLPSFPQMILAVYMCNSDILEVVMDTMN